MPRTLAYLAAVSALATSSIPLTASAATTQSEDQTVGGESESWWSSVAQWARQKV